MTPEKKKHKKDSFYRKETKTILYVIIAFTLLLYLRVFSNDLTNRDDETYIILNPYIESLNQDNLKLIFSTSYMGNYHPLSMVSFAIGYQLGGTNAWPYQLINILLHAGSTLFVFYLISGLLKQSKSNSGQATFIGLLSACLFGIHTLHVESVAWISENKTLLYSFFFLASLLFYLKYTGTQLKKYYYYSLLIFMLSLLSKGMAVSLSLSLIAIDYFLERRLLSGKVILEKVPFFVLSIVFGIIAIKAQDNAINSLQQEVKFGFPERISFAGYGLLNYVFKLFLPVNLSTLYEYPYKTYGPVPAYYYVCLAITLIGFCILIVRFRKSRTIMFGSLFFVFNIIFVLQVLPVGNAIMADRYSYIPSIGFFYILSYTLYQLIEHKNRQVAYGLLAVYIVLISFLTYQRIGVWRNSITLWNDTLKKAKYQEGSKAWLMRASTYNRTGKYKEALNDINRYIPYHRNDPTGFFERAVSKRFLKKNDEAYEDLNVAIALKTTIPEAYHNRGIIKMDMKDYFGALEDFNQALDIKRNFTEAFIARADVKVYLHDYLGAVSDLDTALFLYPYDAEVYNNRGTLKKMIRDYHGALDDFNKAIALNNSLKTAYQNRVDVLMMLEDYENAIRDLNLLLSGGHNPIAYYYRGLAKIKLGLNQDGCQDIQRASEFGYKDIDPDISVLCNISTIN